MNRQIKFRVWDKKKKEMSVGMDLNMLAGYLTAIYPNLGNEEFSQSTGLLDKDGKEIYEGDIVKAQREDDMEYESEESMEKVFTEEAKIAIIEWDDEMTGFHLPSELAFDEYCPSINDDDIKVEVIGNIHENPELLSRA